MKKALLGALLMIGFLFVQANAQPKIEIVGGDTYDWGKVKYAESPLQAKVKIKNTGDKLLEITEVKPGCGCTQKNLDKDKLNPGETATLELSLRLNDNPGHVSKTVRISSNDPRNPHKMLMLKCEVFTPLVSKPNTFSFRSMKVGYESVATVKIKNSSNEPITLSDYKVYPDNMTVNLTGPRKLAPGEEFDVVARIKPMKSGYFNCSLEMKTSSKDAPSFKIGGYGRVEKSSIYSE